MKNKYPGDCYYCGLHVEKLKGLFDRFDGKWRLQHSECVTKWKADKKQKENANEPKAS